MRNNSTKARRHRLYKRRTQHEQRAAPTRTTRCRIPLHPLCKGALWLGVATLTGCITWLSVADPLEIKNPNETASVGANPTPRAAGVADSGDSKTQARKGKTSAEPPLPPQGPVVLNPKEVDFGEVQRGQTAEATVELTNVTNELIHITRAKASCGCTVVDLPQDDLKPGETISVRVQLKPTQPVGAKLGKSVYFTFDGGVEPVALSVFAEVVEFVTVTPGRVDLGVVPIGTVTLRARDEQPFKIIGVEPAVFLGGASLEANTQHSVIISRQLWRQHGSPREIVLLLDHPQVDRVTVEVRGGNRSPGSGIPGVPGVSIPGVSVPGIPRAGVPGVPGVHDPTHNRNQDSSSSASRRSQP